MTTLPEGWWVLLGVSLLLWIIFKVKSVYSYFEKRGIPYVKPVFPLGSDVRGALGKDFIAIVFDRIYKALKGEKFGGFFLGIFPMFMVKDAEYVHRLLVTDFENFHDRSFIIDEETNPLEGHIFFLRGNKWKFLRSKLSPVFTPGKIKFMYEEMSKCSDILIEHMDMIADGRDIDMHETFAKFATDVIGSTAFGLEPECFKKTDSKLRAMGKKFFDMTLWMAIYVFIRIAAPRLVIAMKIKGVDDAVNEYFLSLFQQVFDQRRKNEVTRNDFVQLALQLSDKGHIEVDTSELKDELSTAFDSEKAIETFEITDKVLAAQAFLFYLGGFETLSTTLHFTIYLLAVHGEVQERAREEVKRVKQKYGTFSYEALKELTYLEKCINESVRLFPAVPFLFRECTKDYTFPDGTTIEKGVRCILPVFSMHRDPRYFPDPEEFRPERFDEPMPRGAFLPFGEGPRMCIGKRFALVELKMALAKLLHRYRIEESPLMKKPIQLAPNMILSPLNPLLVKISKCQE